jgi:hypothetical protein
MVLLSLNYNISDENFKLLRAEIKSSTVYSRSYRGFLFMGNYPQLSKLSVYPQLSVAETGSKPRYPLIGDPNMIYVGAEPAVPLDKSSFLMNAIRAFEEAREE